MTQDYDLLGLVEKIRQLRSTATELKALSGGMQAVECNADRMLACIRLLELDFSDVLDIVYDKAPEQAGVQQQGRNRTINGSPEFSGSYNQPRPV